MRASHGIDLFAGQAFFLELNKTICNYVVLNCQKVFYRQFKPFLAIDC